MASNIAVRLRFTSREKQPGTRIYQLSDSHPSGTLGESVNKLYSKLDAGNKFIWETNCNDSES